MTPGDARRFIDRHFRERDFHDSVGDHISETKFLEILNAIEKLIPFQDRRKNQNLARFLWSGCRKFGRWFAPSPYVVLTEFKVHHARFVDAFLRAECGAPDNVAVFLLHSVRDMLYGAFDSVSLPLSDDQAYELAGFCERAAKIVKPNSTIKRKEFEKEYDELRLLFDGLRVGNLQTICKFSIPNPLVRRPVSLITNLEGIRTECQLVPTFSQPEPLKFKPAAPAVMVPTGPSRWQFGTTEIEIRFHALIDPSVAVDPLQLPMEPLPYQKWPKIFRVTFQLLYEAAWKLRSSPDYLNIWIPSPADLSDIEYTVSHPSRGNVGKIWKGNPSLLSMFFVPRTEPPTEPINLDDLELTSWPERCRLLAEQYLTLGDTREAVFWLNVAAESLLNDRMLSMLAEFGVSIDVAELAGARSYWDEARTLVSSQSPELADTISWPETAPTAPSMFRRVKFFAKQVPLATRVRDVLSHYAKIHRHRNSLFHGSSEAPVDPADVKVAVESFDWLLANFRPEPTD